MATAGKGLPFIGKMNEFLDRVLHPTVQRAGNSRAAIDVIHRGYYVLNPVPTVPYVVEAGSTDNLVKLTAHGMRKGDLFRLVTTVNPIQEFEIVVDEIVDANNFKLAGYLSASLSTGDTFFGLRPISERFDSTGATLASITTPAVSYNRKSGGVTVQTSVLEDLDTPANSRAMPVVLHGVDAASISITSNDLNIASSHVNDSMRLGDGTTLTGVTANNELKVRDADSIAAIGTVVTGQTGQNTLLGAVTETVPASDTASSGLNGRLQRIAQRLTSLIALLPVSLGTKAAASSLAITWSSEDEALVGALVETVPASDTASSGLNGRLQRIAQRLTSLIALLPVSIGQKLMAGSLSVTIASDQGSIGSVSVASSALPTGAATSANQTSELALLTNLNSVEGTTGDAAATTDTGTFTMVSLFKRALQNWTTLLGRLPPALGAQVAGSSLSVTQASSTTFAVVQAVKVPTYGESLVITQASVITLSAPATARWMKVQADDTNSVNLRYKVAAVPSATSGFQLQPGRSEDWDVAGDVQVIAESTASAQKLYVTWGQ